jgi:outer membrane lipoprotein-sorting protein
MFKVIFILLCTSLFGQNNSSALLKEVQEKYTSFNDFTAQFTQLVNGKIAAEGKIFFKKENKLRAEFKNNTIVSDGEMIWNYSLRDNKVIINYYDENDPSLISFNKILFDYPSQCILSTGEEAGKKILVLKPKKGSQLTFTSAKLYIGEKGFVESVLVDDNAAGILNIKLSGYKWNQNLSNSKFTFSPPEGSKVIDLR